jgi:3-oxo-5alpha-steroid 4-dehydrogenase
MEQVFITAPAYPPAILLTGIIVNKLGQRFVAEDSYHSRTSGFVMDQPDSAAFLIVDEAHMERPRFPLIKFIDGWETVPEMEAALDIPDGNLVATLDRYNFCAARGDDPDFHKQPQYLAPQDKGPWGAFDLSLGKAMYSGFTVGGLAVSVDGQVLREDVEYRAGRKGVCQRDAAGGGIVLRAPRRSTRREAAGSAGALDRLAFSPDRTNPPFACAEQLEYSIMVLLNSFAVAHANQDHIGQLAAH